MTVEIGHPIKVAARRSGLTPHAIRVWEKRYGAVEPNRTTSNRRLYSEADIERLRLLRQATASGHSIGQIATLPGPALASLVRAEAAAGGRGPADQEEEAREAGADQKDSREYVERCLAAIQRFDAAGLEQELVTAAVHLSQPGLLEEVIEPLMHRIGAMWRDGQLRIADEHLASAAIRSFVDSLRAAFPASPSSPRIIVTTPAGQLHEIGALMVSAQAAREGWHTTYLGASLPAREIARAAHQQRARAVALSLVYPEDDPRLGSELVRLRRGLPEDTALLVGGRAAARHQDLLERIGAVHLPTLSSLGPALAELRES
jgi:DNA-binding transcriptional MerR regulator/methylmalonyl-CoA mutase cobalamin-binding subunit